MDVTRQKAKQIKDDYISATKKRDELMQQHTEQNLSFPEARDRLMEKVKVDNAGIQSTEKRIRELKEYTLQLKKGLTDLENELEEKKAPQEDMQKYEILWQKDQEMQEFIDNFEGSKQKEEEMMRQ